MRGSASHRSAGVFAALRAGGSARMRAKPVKIPFFLPFHNFTYILTAVTADTFKQEIAEAMKAYDKYVICIDKTPDEFHTSLVSLLNKAIKAYENRGPQLRHGIALDRQVTVILSQNDTPRPLCGIYFNLHSPYQKPTAPKALKAVREPISGSSSED